MKVYGSLDEAQLEVVAGDKSGFKIGRVFWNSVAAAVRVQSASVNFTLMFNPMTTAGDITYGAASGVPTRLAAGTTSQALIIAAGIPAWGTLPLLGGGTGATTKAGAFDALSPMTTSGDILYGGASGTGTRLAIGTTSQPLIVVAGAPAWGTLPILGGGTSATTKSGAFDALSPMTTLGDIVYGGASGTGTRLGIGSTSQALFVTAGIPSWGTLPLAGGGTSATTKSGAFDALSPMTTSGDIIYGGASGTGTRLAKGTDGSALLLVSGVPAWSTSNFPLTGPIITGAQLTFGTASNTNFLSLPTNTTTNLAALTQTSSLIAYDTTKLKPVYNNGTSWQTIGTGSSSINYLSANPDAEADTTGWATYVDAAATIPVDGTGGSPSSTFTRSTVTPLRGTASFLWTKTAVNRQGEGFSYAFTIDSADKTKVLSISFDYTIASGTYVDGDMIVYIYDVTNAALIEPAGKTLLGGTVALPLRKTSCTFQTASNSTSYRLIIHTSSTSASAYTVEFDNFSVGPQISVSAPAIADSVSFTPVSTWVSNATHTGKYHRVGNRMFGQVQIALTGAPTSAALVLNMPSGKVIDTSDLINSTDSQILLGRVEITDAGTQAYKGDVVYQTNSTMLIMAENASGTYLTNGTNVTQAVPITFGSGDLLVIKFEVPIVGWSSNSVDSSDSDTRVVAARYTSSATQSFSNTTAAIVDYETKVFDTHGAVTTGASWKFTAPVTGVYAIQAKFVWTNDADWNAGDLAELYVRKNGTIFQTVIQTLGTISSPLIPQETSTTVSLIVGDYIDIQGKQTSGGTVTFEPSVNYQCVNIFRLSGPAVITATESVNARYYASSTSISGSLATVSWTTKDFDSHLGMSSGTYTIPVSGKFQINSALAMTGTYALNSLITMEIQKNGTVVSRSKSYAGGVVTQLDGFIEDIISCVQGDTIRIQVSNSCTSPVIVTSNFENYMSISRVGN